MTLDKNKHKSQRKKLTPALFFLLITALATSSLASVALASELYLPVVMREWPQPTPTPMPAILITDIFAAPQPPFDPIEHELVKIKNVGATTADMTGWYLRDQSGNIYNFPDGFKIHPDKSVEIWSGSGKDSSIALYWGSSHPIWNDESECGFLHNQFKTIVSKFCY